MYAVFTVQLRLITVASVVAIIVLPVCGKGNAFSSGNQMNISDATVKLHAGYFLDLDYISRLKRCRSPLKSTIQDMPQMVIADDAGTIIFVYNFHEGGQVYSYSEIFSKYVLTEAAGLSLANDHLQITSSDKFDYFSNGKKLHSYIHVGNAAAYVGNMLLAGNYIDKNGLNYHFGDNGHARFGENEVFYKIGLDHIEYNYDYVRIFNGKEQVYRFLIEEEYLYLFNKDTGSNMSNPTELNIVLRKCAP